MLRYLYSSCTGTHTHTNTENKRIKTPTSEGSFSSDAIPYTPYKSASEFMHWYVRKYTSAFLPPRPPGFYAIHPAI